MKMHGSLIMMLRNLKMIYNTFPLKFIEGVGHIPMEEVPESALDVLNFLKK